MKRVKFGQLNIGDKFYWNGVLLKKIGQQFAEIIRNGKLTGRRVELAHNVTVEIDQGEFHENYNMVGVCLWRRWQQGN